MVLLFPQNNPKNKAMYCSLRTVRLKNRIFAQEKGIQPAQKTGKQQKPIKSSRFRGQFGLAS